MPEIFEKWGFGMAPVKPSIQKERIAAVAYISDVMETSHQPSAEQPELNHMSIVKGLFSRVSRQDQWDWFTVMGQLGYPSAGLSKIIACRIAELRSAVGASDEGAMEEARSNLGRFPVRRCLSVFLGRGQIIDEPGAGWLYILSTREFKDLLKIGMTMRSVEERVREINTATGVAIPFGVRRCWRVIDPSRAERLVHNALADYRIRKDREFFRLDFRIATPIISTLLRTERLEIRTLNNLAALG
jgi:hypothetical protein